MKDQNRFEPYMTVLIPGIRIEVTQTSRRGIRVDVPQEMTEIVESWLISKNISSSATVEYDEKDNSTLINPTNGKIEDHPKIYRYDVYNIGDIDYELFKVKFGAMMSANQTGWRNYYNWLKDANVNAHPQKKEE